MVPYTLYIVDDEQSLARGIAASLLKEYRAIPYTTAEDALAAIKAAPPDLVLLDIGLPGMSGIEALEKIKKDYPDIIVVMITAYEDIDTVISAMRLGAYDYIIKPIQMDSLLITIHNALETIRLRKEIIALQDTYLKENLPFFVGKSKAIQDVMQLVGSVSKSTDTPVLVVGETGTGKELIASAIHYRSPLFRGPLVTVNCAAIPKDLLESELFGYEKGAFSGANVTGKRGLVEAAANGTLFLDEIGDLSLEAQAKLLRFLETGDFYKVGGTKKIKINTRIISATNKNLEVMMHQGLFREDLYYRISVVKIEIPTLSRRQDDILPIARQFLVDFSNKFGKTFTSISPEAEAALLNHHWSGNVRELKNIVERAALIGNGPELTPADLGLGTLTADVASSVSAPMIPAGGVDLDGILAALEQNYIEEALRMAGGNEARAAELLHMKYTTLRYRCRHIKKS
jgi:DNA-binding NtrC family response regulator